MSLAKKLGLATKAQRSWVLYDWANSAFPTIMMTAVLPLYYSGVAGKDLESHQATAYWGYTSSLALAIIAFMSPFFGALADLRQWKKNLLFVFTIVGIIASGLMSMVGPGDWLLASMFFILGNIGFALADIFYGSLLPSIAKPNETSRVSSAGYAIGYLGGGLLLAFDLALIQKPELFGLQDAGTGVRWSFVSVAFWWGLFSIPLFKNVPEPQKSTQCRMAEISFWEPLKQVWTTLKSVRQYKNTFLFLAAFWAYNDGIGTIIKMATIFGKEVGIETSDLIGAILMVQFVGLPATLILGQVATKIGDKTSLMICLVVYSIICILGYYMTEGWQFWLLAGLVSLVQGPAQALSRSLFVKLTPPEKSAEFFGFYSFSGKFAGIIGPLLFAILTQLFEGSRYAILAIIVLFIIGAVLLSRVKESETPPPT